MKYFFRYNISSKKIYYVLIFPYGIYFMEYVFRCNGNFIIDMEKILHEIDSIWKNYCIIQFLWNKYYARTNISSQYRWSLFVLLCNQCQSPLMFWVRIPFMASCTRFNIMWTSLSVMYDRWMVVSGYPGFLYQ
jgi:hypothetical protein